MRGSHRGLSCAIVAGLAAAGLLTACGGAPSASRASSAPTSTTSSTPTLSASPDPARLAAEAALAAYRAFREAQAKAEAVADAKGSALETFAVDQALAGVYSTIVLLQRQGIVVRGRPRLNPRVTAIALGPPPRAVIEDCFDTSAWEAVYRTTGRSAVAPNQVRRSVVEVTTTVYNGRWVVRTITNERDRRC